MERHLKPMASGRYAKAAGTSLMRRHCKFEDWVNFKVSEGRARFLQLAFHRILSSAVAPCSTRWTRRGGTRSLSSGNLSWRLQPSTGACAMAIVGRLEATATKSLLAMYAAMAVGEDSIGDKLRPHWTEHGVRLDPCTTSSDGEQRATMHLWTSL